MYLIKPSVELWPAPEQWQEQVARAARLCYASEGGQKSAEDFCEMLKKRNHLSMFRHAISWCLTCSTLRKPIKNISRCGCLRP